MNDKEFTQNLKTVVLHESTANEGELLTTSCNGNNAGMMSAAMLLIRRQSFIVRWHAWRVCNPLLSCQLNSRSLCRSSLRHYQGMGCE